MGATGNRLSRRPAVRYTGAIVIQQVRQGGFTESSLDHGRGLVELPVKRTQPRAVLRATQGTLTNPLDRLDGVDHIKKPNTFRRASERETAMQAALRADQPGPPEQLHDLGEVAQRHLGSHGNLLRGERAVRPTGQMHHGPQGIFGGLRDHPRLPRGFRAMSDENHIYYIWILTSINIRVTRVQVNLFGYRAEFSCGGCRVCLGMSAQVEGSPGSP